MFSATVGPLGAGYLGVSIAQKSPWFIQLTRDHPCDWDGELIELLLPRIVNTGAPSPPLGLLQSGPVSAHGVCPQLWGLWVQAPCGMAVAQELQSGWCSTPE